jgi:hypothetical protein
MNSYTLEPVGFIRSTVKGREDALWLEIEPRFAEALLGMEVGQELSHPHFASRQSRGLHLAICVKSLLW